MICYSFSSYQLRLLAIFGINNLLLKILKLTNRKLFRVVCTLIDKDIRHFSGQNVVDSRGAAKEVFFFFQSVTKIMTQRKSKRCLQLSRNMIGLFHKMGVPDWPLHCVTN